MQSAIVSVVGDDFPQEYLDLLTSRNIDISGLEVQGGKTFFGAVTTMT
jgi:sugar/nucleoside kinase (ribokinase family)